MVIDSLDIDAYILESHSQEKEASLCLDLNQDDTLDIYDAALLLNCHENSSNMSDYCEFPRGVLNPFQTTSFKIGNVNYTEQYFDIQILNQYNEVLDFQLNV